MATIINKDQMISIVADMDVIAAMEVGFKAYSNGQTVVPPVGELLFENPKGEAHIKYGYIKRDDYYVIKIASGFYDNPKLGIASSQGMMLLFNQKTGQPVAVLLDEGYLTDVRTAAAGALAARYFAPSKVQGIGIIGTGIQARLQLEYLREVTDCRQVWVWGRNNENAEQFKNDMQHDWEVTIASDTTKVARNCNLIVTTTPAQSPLLHAADIMAGTHITAMGSDTAHKQELDGAILAKADIVIADSIPQCKSRGEVFQAIEQQFIAEDQVVELGHAIQKPELQRQNDDQLTIVDLTGVAVQDIMIAKAVWLSHLKSSSTK